MHVTVLMSVWNEIGSISVAIKSIIEQTYDDWDLLIIDDCSTDGTHKLLMEFESIDARIKVVRNSKNRGLPRSLNKGWKLAKGPLLARMDGDDFSFPDRLEKQVSYLSDHPHVDVLGSNAELIDLDGNISGYATMPETHQKIGDAMHRKSPFIHPSVMLKKSFYVRSDGYNNHLRRNQDYVLWAKMHNKSTYHNLQDVLIRYQTRSYVLPFKTIFYGLYASIYITRYHKRYLAGFSWAFTIFGSSLLVKSGLYRPISLRASKTNDLND